MSISLQQTNHLIQPGTVLEISKVPKRIPLSSESLTAGTWLITAEFELKTKEGESNYLPKLEAILTANGVQECSGILAMDQKLFHNHKFPYTFNSIITKLTDFKVGFEIEYALVDFDVEITMKRFIAVKV